MFYKYKFFLFENGHFWAEKLTEIYKNNVAQFISLYIDKKNATQKMQRLPYPFFALKKSITFEILISFDRRMLRLQENGFNLFGIHFSQYQLHFYINI